MYAYDVGLGGGVMNVCGAFWYFKHICKLKEWFSASYMVNKVFLATIVNVSAAIALVQVQSILCCTWGMDVWSLDMVSASYSPPDVCFRTYGLRALQLVFSGKKNNCGPIWICIYMGSSLG